MKTKPTRRYTLGQAASLAALALVLAAGGCTRIDSARQSNWIQRETPEQRRARLCPVADSADKIPLWRGAASAAALTFDDLAREVDNACKSCHLTPAAQGGFTYQHSYRGGVIFVGSTRMFVPGFYDVADQMADALLGSRMPPQEIRELAPASYLTLGRTLKGWIDSGRPQGTFAAAGGDMDQGAPVGGLPGHAGEKMTNLGDCIPSANVIGTDTERDGWFAAATSLPRNLADTDVNTLDTLALAEHGTVAFAPTYQLFSDNAKKERLVHVPAGRRIEYDSVTGKFDIPENTRFYKTFFKAVTEADGRLGYRKIETRLIVSRTPWERSLFGTYVWNASGTSAVLLEDAYRSGEPFRDRLFTYETDERTHATRHYALPAKHRCIQCHQGAEGQNFVLGFTPLQINRRVAGNGGVMPNDTVGESEVGQAERLLAYGVVGGFVARSELPRLEDSAGTRRPRNEYELRAQAHMVGNCAHCHNQQGFAPASDPALAWFDLSPGGVVFQFPLDRQTVSSARRYVLAGTPRSSEIFVRVSQSSQVDPMSGRYQQHMPLNAPGLDCASQQKVGQWIASIPVVSFYPTEEEIAQAMLDAEDRIALWEHLGCDPDADIDWVLEDFTEPPGPYMPRRGDWATAIPARFRNMAITDPQKTFVERRIPFGWWPYDSRCHYPTVTESELRSHAEWRSWMVDSSGRYVNPLGQIKFLTPGEYLFGTVCNNCHGPRADGTGGLGKALLAATGGATRPANLMQGLFGPLSSPLENLRMFSSLGRPDDPPDPVPDGAARYLVWMASGGTLAYFPAGFGGHTVGAYGGNMLNQFRDLCQRYLPGFLPRLYRTSDPSSELVYDLCTFENSYDAVLVDGEYRPVTHGLDREDPVTRAWLDLAQFNGGIAAYYYLKDYGARGRWTPRTCQEAFP